MSTSIFSPEALNKIITETLPPDVPAGGGVVIGTVDQNGAQVVASFRKGTHWELQAAARHDWGADNSVGGRVLLRW